MALKTVLQTEDFEIWLDAYTSIVDVLNENFGITLTGRDYDPTTLTILNTLRDKIEASLNINKAGIFADSADHEYIGQFFDELATFEGTVANNDFVYKNLASGNYHKAQADSLDTLNVVGVADVTNGKVISSGFVNIGTAIVANTKIFLSEDTAGAVTATETSVSVGLALGGGVILLGTVGGSGGSGGAEFTSFLYTATAAQTLFTGLDDNSNSLLYYVDKVQVFVNGILLNSADYTASSGTSITITAGLDVGDLVDIFGYVDGPSLGVGVTQFIFTLSASQVLVENPLFVAGNTLCFFNGLKLNHGVDFIDTVSGQITLTGITVELNDILDVQVYSEEVTAISGSITSMDDVESDYSGSASQPVWINNTGDGIEFGNPWVTLIDNHSMDVTLYSKVFLDSTTQTFGITLPTTPNDGFEVELVDVGSNLTTNNVSIAYNGNNIEGLAENLILDTNGISIRMVFVNSTIGWKILYL